MITPEIKDLILGQLVEGDGMTRSFNIKSLSCETGLSIDVINAILEHFEELGLCRVSRCLGGRVDVSLNVKAHDMVLHGGFVAQEELLKQSIEKLMLELEKLRPDSSDAIERISGIIANIGTALGLFM